MTFQILCIVHIRLGVFNKIVWSHHYLFVFLFCGLPLLWLFLIATYLKSLNLMFFINWFLFFSLWISFSFPYLLLVEDQICFLFSISILYVFFTSYISLILHFIFWEVTVINRSSNAWLKENQFHSMPSKYFFFQRFNGFSLKELKIWCIFY